jgi:hypothetical protein
MKVSSGSALLSEVLSIVVTLASETDPAPTLSTSFGESTDDGEWASLPTEAVLSSSSRLREGVVILTSDDA